MTDPKRINDIENRLYTGKTITHDEAMFLVENGRVVPGKIPESYPKLAKAVEEAVAKYRKTF